MEKRRGRLTGRGTILPLEYEEAGKPVLEPRIDIEWVEEDDDFPAVEPPGELEKALKRAQDWDHLNDKEEDDDDD